jgi:putative transcriptional regulator
VREAGVILRGQKKSSWRVVIGASRVPTIRRQTKLSQSEFARLIGVSVKTLQNWEQDRKIIAHEPRLAIKAIHRASALGHIVPSDPKHRKKRQIRYNPWKTASGAPRLARLTTHELILIVS